MKKTVFVIALLVILAGMSSFAQNPQSPVRKGPYLGQTPPEMVPERFAPGFMSSAGYDLTPTFSPGLDEMFFGRRASEEGSDNRIYYSRMTRGRWEDPVPAAFSSGVVEYEAQFSVDGGRVYFNRGKQIFFSQKTEAGWSEARPVEAPADEGMCAAPARNGALYFTAARNKAYGIFRSGLVDGRYQAPEIVIRMAAHPWVAPDESFLVFDKYAFADGVQTSKLYASFRRADGSWSDPVELGKDVNATGTELIPKVSPDGKYLFFQRKVDGNTDIYWVDARVIEAVK